MNYQTHKIIASPHEKKVRIYPLSTERLTTAFNFDRIAGERDVLSPSSRIHNSVTSFFTSGTGIGSAAGKPYDGMMFTTSRTHLEQIISHEFNKTIDAEFQSLMSISEDAEFHQLHALAREKRAEAILRQSVKLEGNTYTVQDYLTMRDRLVESLQAKKIDEHQLKIISEQASLIQRLSNLINKANFANNPNSVKLNNVFGQLNGIELSVIQNLIAIHQNEIKMASFEQKWSQIQHNSGNTVEGENKLHELENTVATLKAQYETLKGENDKLHTRNEGSMRFIDEQKLTGEKERAMAANELKKYHKAHQSTGTMIQQNNVVKNQLDEAHHYIRHGNEFLENLKDNIDLLKTLQSKVFNASLNTDQRVANLHSMVATGQIGEKIVDQLVELVSKYTTSLPKFEKVVDQMIAKQLHTDTVEAKQTMEDTVNVVNKDAILSQREDVKSDIKQLQTQIAHLTKVQAHVEAQLRLTQNITEQNNQTSAQVISFYPDSQPNATEVAEKLNRQITNEAVRLSLVDNEIDNSTQLSIDNQAIGVERKQEERGILARFFGLHAANDEHYPEVKLTGTGPATVVDINQFDIQRSATAKTSAYSTGGN